MENFSNTLLQQFNSGDETAFNQFFKSHYRALIYFASRLSLSKEDAEEVVAEKFASLFLLVRNGRHFESLEHIRNFLYKSVRNGAITLSSQLSRKANHDYNYVNAFPTEQEEWINGSWLKIETEMLRQVYDAAELLPAECKKIFKMLYYQNLDTREVAKELDLAPQTVLNQKSRAIMLIKKHIFNPNPLLVAGVTIGLLALGLYLLTFILPI